MKLPAKKGTKKKEITMHFLFLEPAIDVKVGPDPEGGESRFWSTE